MTASEFAAAREALQISREMLAIELNLRADIIEGFEDGSLSIPKHVAAEMRWRVAGKEREDALAASGLPECGWIAEWERKAPTLSGKASIKHLEALNEHAGGCATCTARDAYVLERFGPMPEMPVRGWLGVLASITKRVERLPEWSRPGAWGALTFLAYTTFKLIFALPAVLKMPGGWMIPFKALALSGSIGAAIGLAYGALKRGWQAFREARTAAS
jgi:hypothetical protein